MYVDLKIFLYSWVHACTPGRLCSHGGPCGLDKRLRSSSAEEAIAFFKEAMASLQSKLGGYTIAEAIQVMAGPGGVLEAALLACLCPALAGAAVGGGADR